MAWKYFLSLFPPSQEFRVSPISESLMRKKILRQHDKPRAAPESPITMLKCTHYQSDRCLACTEDKMEAEGGWMGCHDLKNCIERRCRESKKCKLSYSSIGNITVPFRGKQKDLCLIVELCKGTCLCKMVKFLTWRNILPGILQQLWPLWECQGKTNGFHWLLLLCFQCKYSTCALNGKQPSESLMEKQHQICRCIKLSARTVSDTNTACLLTNCPFLRCSHLELVIGALVALG